MTREKPTMPELARDEQQNSRARASAHAAEATDGKPRLRWSSHTTFLLASIGSAIGFGNVWRFPMMAYSYGGGAFMLPYLIALFFAAIPMVVLEFALGQRLQRGHVALVAHIAPRWEGLGWATVVGTFLSAQYYQVSLKCPCSPDPDCWGPTTLAPTPAPDAARLLPRLLGERVSRPAAVGGRGGGAFSLRVELQPGRSGG